MRRSQGEKHFVIDLGACTGMDSTFMGQLTSLAKRASKEGGSVQIASPGEKNRRSLEDLGLDCLMEISPANADWSGKEDEIRANLEPFQSNRLPDARERARHVLDSHKTLASTSDENAKRFETVLQVMEREAKESSRKDSH